MFSEHPKALKVVFFSELWERFSFFGMRALLVLYLIDELQMAEDKALLVFGAYSSFTFLLPLLGGVFADRYLGYGKAVILGSIFVLLGHIMLVLDHSSIEAIQIVPGQLEIKLIYCALATIAVGVGLLKSSISVLVGALYKAGDKRRDSGFSLFYMGINLGALVAPIVCGFVGQRYGWNFGFGIAGLGVLTGLLYFAKNYSLVKQSTFDVTLWVPSRLAHDVLAFLGILLFILISATLIEFSHLAGYALLLVSIGVGCYLTVVLIYNCDTKARREMLVLICMMLFASLFWSLIEQAGGSLNIFTHKYVNRILFGFEIPAAMFQAIDPLVIVLCLPLFNKLWIRLGETGKDISAPTKFCIALLILSAGFLLLAAGIHFREGHSVAMGWVVLIFVFMAVGECFLAPIGLSLTTTLSLPKLAATMIGVWYLSVSIGSYVAAFIAASVSNRVSVTDITLVDDSHYIELLHNFSDMYFDLALMGFGAFLLLFMARPFLQRVISSASASVEKEEALPPQYSTVRESTAANK